MKAMNKNFERIVSFLLAAIIAFSLIPCISIDASAATNGHTQSEAVSWAKAQVGKSLDFDGVYGCQCVDLVKFYYNWMGVASYAKGNACEYQTNALPGGWKRVSSGFKVGDIAVWKPSFSYGDYKTGAAGHVGIIVSVSDSKITVINQNFAGKSYCTSNVFPTAVIACAIRPDFSTAALSATWSGPTATKVTKNNAYLSGKITFNQAVKYTAAGVRLYDAKGNIVAQKDEKPGNTAKYLEIWYDIKGELGVTLKAATKYSFKFYVKVDGKTYWSKSVSFVTAPATPTLTAAKKSSTSASLSWTKASGASGYAIYRATSKNGEYKKVKTIDGASTLKWTNTGLSKGHTYYYKIRAFKTVSGTNIYGSYSAIKSVKL